MSRKQVYAWKSIKRTKWTALGYRLMKEIGCDALNYSGLRDEQTGYDGYVGLFWIPKLKAYTVNILATDKTNVVNDRFVVHELRSGVELYKIFKSLVIDTYLDDINDEFVSENTILCVKTILDEMK